MTYPDPDNPFHWINNIDGTRTVKPEPTAQDEERKLRVRISLLEDRLKYDGETMGNLLEQIETLNTVKTTLEAEVKTTKETLEAEVKTTKETLQAEIDTMRKSTMHNFSVYMQTNIVWISKIGTFILGCIASPTVIYIVQKALGS